MQHNSEDMIINHHDVAGWALIDQHELSDDRRRGVWEITDVELIYVFATHVPDPQQEVEILAPLFSMLGEDEGFQVTSAVSHTDPDGTGSWVVLTNAPAEKKDEILNFYNTARPALGLPAPLFSLPWEEFVYAPPREDEE